MVDVTMYSKGYKLNIDGTTVDIQGSFTLGTTIENGKTCYHIRVKDSVDTHGRLHINHADSVDNKIIINNNFGAPTGCNRVTNTSNESYHNNKEEERYYKAINDYNERYHRAEMRMIRASCV